MWQLRGLTDLVRDEAVDDLLVRHRHPVPVEHHGVEDDAVVGIEPGCALEVGADRASLLHDLILPE